jgi:hypothetical protein
MMFIGTADMAGLAGDPSVKVEVVTGTGTSARMTGGLDVYGRKMYTDIGGDLRPGQGVRVWGNMSRLAIPPSSRLLVSLTESNNGHSQITRWERSWL